MYAFRRASTSSLPAHSLRYISRTSIVAEAAGTVSSAPKPTLQWSRPIRAGVVPAYDHALGFIRRDSESKLARLESLKVQIQSVDTSSPEYEQLAKRIQKLEIESRINEPEVRWNFKHGVNVDMSTPVYRHLTEKSWRNEGRLDCLMQRVHQMHVVPDAVSSIQPSTDLYVHFDPAKSIGNTSKSSDVEPGVFLSASETRDLPRIRATAFHPDTRLYTLMILDLDVPSPETQSFTTYLHYLKPNIPISAASYSNDIPLDEALVPYIPPHPQHGTPYHRYVTLLLPQSDLKAPLVVEGPPKRLGFDIRRFINKHELGSTGSTNHSSGNDYAAHVAGGIHMWREKWDASVTQIYQEVLQIPEPRYGPQPKIDPYGGKRLSRYE